MLEVGWSEILVIAIVLIVVVGPKDLPNMLRTFGTTMRKMRAMASDFQTQFGDALKEAELDEVRKTIDDVRGLNPRNAIRDALDPLRQAGEDVKRELSRTDADIRAKAASMDAPVAAPAVAPLPMVTVPAATVALDGGMPGELMPAKAAAIAAQRKAKTAPPKRQAGMPSTADHARGEVTSIVVSPGPAKSAKVTGPAKSGKAAVAAKPAPKRAPSSKKAPA
jgi:sec-independent protein translocase protein TatB